MKGEQQYADEQDEALGIFQHSNSSFLGKLPILKNIYEISKAKINQEMEPYKKQNKQLMSIIGAAEKGHNLLLNTMQNINSEIAGNF